MGSRVGPCSRVDIPRDIFGHQTAPSRPCRPGLSPPVSAVSSPSLSCPGAPTLAPAAHQMEGTVLRDGLEAPHRSPLQGPPCICRPFPSLSAPCTCTPRQSGIYPAPGAQCEGSALINLTGTTAWASCLACIHGDNIRVLSASGWCLDHPLERFPS